MRSNTRYTTAVQICIFLNYREEAIVSSTTIAESVKTNPVVIRRLVHDLKTHGIIASSSGPAGGFYLGRPPEEVSLWDIYLATREEEFFKRPRVNPNCVVSSNLKILVHDVFTEAEKSMKSVLEQKTIADLSKNLDEILGKERAAEAIKKGH